mmetsp:Transcript_35315/g.73525  ORF Transcript_35315/g.73525 Transcript_35315/m.73525 type:complete len:209 (-) Transcript_35315:1284-1910(-)
MATAFVSTAKSQDILPGNAQSHDNEENRVQIGINARPMLTFKRCRKSIITKRWRMHLEFAETDTWRGKLSTKKLGKKNFGSRRWRKKRKRQSLQKKIVKNREILFVRREKRKGDNGEDRKRGENVDLPADRAVRIVTPPRAATAAEVPSVAARRYRRAVVADHHIHLMTVDLATAVREEDAEISTERIEATKTNRRFVADLCRPQDAK